MPGTSMQLYPAAQPRVNGYRSFLAEAGGVGADLLVGASLFVCDAKLALAWRERVNCLLTWLRGCLRPRSFEKLSYLSFSAELTGDFGEGTRSSGWWAGAILMQASGRNVIDAARREALDWTRRSRPIEETGGEDSHRRGTV